jgi:hypothetical protein
MNATSIRLFSLLLASLLLTACNEEEKSATPTPPPAAEETLAVKAEPESAPATPEPLAEAAKAVADEAGKTPAAKPTPMQEELKAQREARQAQREVRRLQREQWWSNETMAELRLTPEQITILEENQAALKARSAETNEKLAALRGGLQAAVQGGDIPALRSSLEQMRALEDELLQAQLNVAESDLQQLNSDQVAWLQQNPRAMRKILRPVLATAMSGKGERSKLMRAERREKRMRDNLDGQNAGD